MKHESNESDIIVYDLPDDYSVRTSSSTKQTTDKGGEEHISVPDQEHGVTGPAALLGGFAGKVYDKLTYRRVEGALVTIVKNLSVKTDERGEFVITNIKPGTYRVTVSEDGYMVQSRKSTAVPGVTTKLDSFHLIPACLADDYPDDAAKEEEEMIEEEVVELATKPPPLTSSEEIICAPEAMDEKEEEEEVVEIVLEGSPEKTMGVVSNVISVEGTNKEIIAALEARETIAKENPIECPETSVGKEALSVLEETVEEPAGGHTVIAPTEKMEETFVDVSITDKIVSISAEEIQTPAIAADLTEAAVSLPEEKDSIETVTSVPEEIVIGDVSIANKLSSASVETNIAETVQPEETTQELPVKETQSRLPWMAWFRRKLKRKPITDNTLEPSMEAAQEITTQEVVVEETPEEEPLGLSIETAQKVATQEVVVEETPEQELFADISLSDEIVFISAEEIQIPAIAVNSTETVVSLSEEKYFAKAVMSVPEEIVVGNVSSIDELPYMSVETDIAETVQLEGVLQELYIKEMTVVEETAQEKVHKEDPVELFIEVALEVTAQELVVEEAYEEELFADISLSDKIVSISAEEIQIPVFVTDPTETVISLPEKRDSTETVMSASEEIAVEEVSPDEMIFQLSDETGIVEMAPLEEVERVFSKKETQSILPWKRWVKNRVKRKFSRQDLLMPSPEDITKIINHNEVVETTLQGKPLESSMEVSQEIIVRDEVLEETHQKELSADVSVEEITEYRTMHEIITGLNKQKKSADVAVDIESEQEAGAAIIEEKPIDYSESHVLADGSVVPRGATLEGISDDDIASISEEERAAMSLVHDSVEVAGFIGVINAQPNPTYKGLPISIAYTLRNISCDDPDDFIVQIVVINSDTGIVYETFETPANCRKGTFSMGGFVIFTTSYETCVYRLNMQVVSEKTKISHLLTGISLEIKSIF